MEQFKEAANVVIVCWDNVLYAWYLSKDSQKRQEITMPFNGDIIPALDSLAQELFKRRIYPLSQIKEIPDGFFPLSHNEEKYFHARFSELEGLISKNQVAESLKKIEEEG